jgi:hypothetical protein
MNAAQCSHRQCRVQCRRKPFSGNVARIDANHAIRQREEMQKVAAHFIKRVGIHSRSLHPPFASVPVAAFPHRIARASVSSGSRCDSKSFNNEVLATVTMNCLKGNFAAGEGPALPPV